MQCTSGASTYSTAFGALSVVAILSLFVFLAVMRTRRTAPAPS